ncbi:hypothetical protein JHW43_008973 [Diplocarpon mali]|nr:hypothetical protein JHW43_008973 [Diplocarpon mali]
MPKLVQADKKALKGRRNSSGDSPATDTQIVQSKNARDARARRRSMVKPADYAREVYHEDNIATMSPPHIAVEDTEEEVQSLSEAAKFEHPAARGAARSRSPAARTASPSVLQTKRSRDKTSSAPVFSMYGLAMNPTSLRWVPPRKNSAYHPVRAGPTPKTPRGGDATPSRTQGSRILKNPRVEKHAMTTRQSQNLEKAIERHSGEKLDKHATDSERSLGKRVSLATRSKPLAKTVNSTLS